MIFPESVCVTGVVSTTRLPPSAENWMKFGREVGSDSSLRTENESPMCRMSKNEMESRVCKKIQRGMGSRAILKRLAIHSSLVLWRSSKSVFIMIVQSHQYNGSLIFSSSLTARERKSRPNVKNSVQFHSRDPFSDRRLQVDYGVLGWAFSRESKQINAQEGDQALLLHCIDVWSIPWSFQPPTNKKNRKQDVLNILEIFAVHQIRSRLLILFNWVT